MSDTKKRSADLQKNDGNEDDINLEVLQAHIDMSMSFAQELVSSWIEPNTVATTSRTNDLEKELREYLRRPPRLGVGAPIPEASTLAREAARLKGRLQDKVKHKRTSEEMDSRQSDLDDQDESKARVINKKTKSDPFAPSRKRFKSKAISAVPTPDDETPHGCYNGRTTLVDQAQPVVIPIAAPQEMGGIKDSLTASISDSEGAYGAIQAATALDKASQSVLPHSALHSTSPLKAAILNLDGPLLSDNDNAQHAQARKKKRKRRKKKKHHSDLQD